MNPLPLAIAIILVGVAMLLIFGGNMSGSYSFPELVSLAQSAGFQGNDAQIAAAIAIAESSGRPNIYNPETAMPTPPQKGSYGLWQIYLNAHPEFSGQNLFDPVTNAQAAFLVYSAAGNSFSPWSTFTNGAYAAYLPPEAVTS